jgi:hypothetical protein
MVQIPIVTLSNVTLRVHQKFLFCFEQEFVSVPERTNQFSKGMACALVLEKVISCNCLYS